MDNICNEDICTGCGACKAICPTNSIILKANEEGFIMPVINDMSCINCGKCKEMCPSNNSLNRNKAVFKVYAAGQGFKWEFKGKGTTPSFGFIANCTFSR